MSRFNVALSRVLPLVLAPLLALGVTLSGTALKAAESEAFTSEAVNASLITAQDGVAPGSATIAAGFKVDLADGWKTYWRTPGEVGTPPRLDWSQSTNIASVDFQWPAPTRFHAFGIENFGYKHEVVFPLVIRLKKAGEPAQLRVDVNMLTCSLVCVPQNFKLALDLPTGSGIDQKSAALIARWSARIPQAGDAAGVRLETASLVEGDTPAIVLTLRSDTPFRNPDIFPEVSEQTIFGPPDIRIGDSGRLLWARVPLTGIGDDGARQVTVTITDDEGARAVTTATRALSSDPPPKPPFTLARAVPTLVQLAKMAAVALLGGLILNVMPCVLPVLSIKLTSVMKAQSQGRGRVREGFLLSALGVMAFMWLLGGLTLGARALGLTVGWGVQFQNPVFLAGMAVLLVLFAANLFGLFEINLPSSMTDKLAKASGQPTRIGDFSTGAFAAVLATPCSAPFLGTAIAFALAGRPVDILVIFTALGLGLALPYLVVAIRPEMVRFMPRPGRWMVLIKLLLGALLALTAVWLFWVMDGVAGRNVVYGVGSVLVVAVALLALRLPERRLPILLRRVAVTALVAASLVVPVMVGGDQPARAANTAQQKIPWVPWVRADIARNVSQGRTVFVNVTADWCLTCKANKTLVLRRGEVARILSGGKVIPMEADWTRPDPRIAKYLEDNGRYGIPFYGVYGPKAPDGIFLPEVLTQKIVLDALRKAGGDEIVRRETIATRK